MLSATKTTLTVNEAAALSGFSRNTIIRMFSNERGVLILSRPEKMHKRRYRTMRIPRHVYERVINRLMV
jgi:predicted DNA-binding transcriptional regulator YafY